MSELNNLLSSYPLSELLLLLVGLLAAGKAIWSLVEYWLEKINIHVGEKYKRQERWDNLDKKFDDLTITLNNHIEDLTVKVDNHIDTLSEKVEELKVQNEQTHEHQVQIDRSLALVQERLQENARSYLLDAHHKFCYEFKRIDDLTLQSIERRYLYYKTAGGDTFIDHLMEEIRELPRVSYYEKPSLTNEL